MVTDVNGHPSLPRRAVLVAAAAAALTGICSGANAAEDDGDAYDELAQSWGFGDTSVTSRSAEEIAAEQAQQAEQAAIEAGLLGWVDPLAGLGRFTSGYGWRDLDLDGVSPLHEGVDLAAPLGTPIHAPYQGVVVHADWGGYGGSGAVVAIRHDTRSGTFLTTYNHMSLSTVEVSVGQAVATGEQVAQVGNEGNSTGPHLHFSTRVPDGVGGWATVDPVPFMLERGVDLLARS